MRGFALVVGLGWAVLTWGRPYVIDTGGPFPQSRTTFRELCPGFTVSDRGLQKIVRCPIDPIERPYLVIDTCPGGRAPIVDKGWNFITTRCP